MSASDSPAKPIKNRRLYIDWMRGLACVLMFQTHVYDSWLSPAARSGRFFALSQRIGGMPAPMFLFLAGISMALLTQSLRKKGLTTGQRIETTVRRGFKIFLLGLAFRLQEYLLGLPWAPWRDLLRVDILNIIGLALMLMGVVISFSKTRRQDYWFTGVSSLAIVMFTPLVWYSSYPRWLPSLVTDYLHGGHRPWFFPIFPWVGFAFAGLFIGTLIISTNEKFKESTLTLWLGAAGIVSIAGGMIFDRLPAQLYPVYDYWHTSPNFFAVKFGVLLLMVCFSYWWCVWWGQKGFSWVAQLGTTSLLVYWVHIEFVYGRFKPYSHELSLFGASVGLAVITGAMLALSVLKTRYREAARNWIMATKARLGAAIL
ncbi:MAG: heparan-alpha-glucosaminide N-acetyltransferase domain-containing protein [Acidobacteriia bacterium]|nr:heparan-alpha-glucosaminide N-acetyltransferase domain-containing protein [Terriglobia bacterium]